MKNESFRYKKDELPPKYAKATLIASYPRQFPGLARVFRQLAVHSVVVFLVYSVVYLLELGFLATASDPSGQVLQLVSMVLFPLLSGLAGYVICFYLRGCATGTRV